MTRFHRFYASKIGVLLAAVVASTGGLGLISASPGFAQEILESQATLAPAEDEYQFEGTSGQTIAISMVSEEFDTLLVLLGPNGEEIAMNDDFARSLNSKIVTTLPVDGTYTVIAKSYSGQGGDYVVSVGTATAFDIAYSEAESMGYDGNFEGAIAAYSEAIAADPSHPAAYLGRADSYFGEAYSRLGENFTGPQDLSAEAREMAASDYETAADLYESQGQPDQAGYLRDQATYIRTGEYPMPEEF